MDLEKTPHVLIEIPGDGDFKVVNSKEALEGFKKLAEEGFPGGPIKVSSETVRKSSEKPTGRRISPKENQEYEYVAEYSPKKISGSEYVDQGKAYAGQGWFGDGNYIVKGEPPKGFGGKLPKKDLTEEKIKAVMPSLRDYKEAKYLTEFHLMNSTKNEGLAIREGMTTGFQPHYMDIVKNRYPDSKVFIKDEESPIIIKQDKDIVGLVMPYKSSGLPDPVKEFLRNEGVKFPEEAKAEETPEKGAVDESQAQVTESKEANATKENALDTLRNNERGPNAVLSGRNEGVGENTPGEVTGIVRLSKQSRKEGFRESQIQIIGPTKEAKRLQADLEISWGKTFAKGTIVEVNVPKDGPSLRSIGRAFGKKVVFVDAKGGILNSNGMTIVETPGVIYVNAKSPVPHLHTLGHELIHTLKAEEPDLYQKLLSTTDDLIQNYEAYQKLLDRSSLATGIPTEVGDAVKEELYADFTGEQFLNKDFWRKLHDREPILFKKVIKLAKDLIDQAVKWLKGKISIQNSFFKDIRKAQDNLADIMKEYAVKKAQPKNVGSKISPYAVIPLAIPFLAGNGGEDRKKVYPLRPETPSYLPPGMGR